MEHELTIRDYVDAFRRRWWIPALCFVIFVALSLLYSASKTPMYRSQSRVLVNQTSAAEVFDPVTGGSSENRRAYNEAEFIESGVVRAAAEAQLGYDAEVSASTDGSSDVITVTAIDSDPRRAQQTARVFAETYRDQRRNLAIADLTETSLVVQAQIDALDAQLAALPEDDPSVAQLQALRRGYSDSLAQFSIASELATGSGALVIDEAGLPDSAFTPQTTRNVALGAILGLLVGAGLVLLMESLDRSMKDKEAVERVSGLPNLAIVPAVSKQRRSKDFSLISLSEPDSNAAEAYRTLRAALQFMAVDQLMSVLQVTSANPSEGKTTTSANLAIALAKAGRRVALVDADLRKPRLHTYFDLDQEPGLTSVMIGEATLTEVCHVAIDDVGVLLVVPAGPIPPGPSELLGRVSAQRAFATLRNVVDVVVVDSPPLLPVSDALVLSNYVDGTVLVTNAARTSEDDLRLALDRLDQVNAEVIGTVLNEVKTKNILGYGYGYGYGYGEQGESRRARSRWSRSKPEPMPVRRDGSLTPSATSATKAQVGTLPAKEEDRTSEAAPTGARSDAQASLGMSAGRDTESATAETASNEMPSSWKGLQSNNHGSGAGDGSPRSFAPVPPTVSSKGKGFAAAIDPKKGDELDEWVDDQITVKGSEATD